MSLNALRAFEAAARHLSFTRAGMELSVTQAAISQQVKALEDRLGVRLFRRTSRGLLVTDEGQSLLPTLTETFRRLNRLMDQFEGGQLKEVLTVGTVGTFAVGWLIPRLKVFHAEHSRVEVRLLTNNNKVDIAAECLDYAIRFGDGAWPGIEAEPLMPAPVTPLCSPRTAERLRVPQDLRGVPLLRSYRTQDWPAWFEEAGVNGVIARGPIFDSSLAMVQSAMLDHGVALAPRAMFTRELQKRELVAPFDTDANVGAYWLTRLVTQTPTPGMCAFRNWIARECSASLAAVVSPVA